MGAPFVKLAANLHGNRKVMQAGRNGRDVFVFVLCQNSMVDGDGSVPLTDMEPWYLARHLQCSEEEAREGYERCVTVGLLSVTGDRVVIVGWDDEWARRPLTDAERAARYRERKKPSRESRPDRDESRDESRAVTSHVGEEKRGEETRGEERESAQAVSPETGSTKPKKRRSPETPIPDDWRPNETAIAKAASIGVDVDREAQRFRNHALSIDRRCVRWDAAFANWLDKSDRNPIHATRREPDDVPGRNLSYDDLDRLQSSLKARGM